MNKGAILLDEHFFTPEQIEEIAVTARSRDNEKFNVHAAGAYAGIQWHQVNVEGRGYAWLDEVYEFLGIESAELSVFYYLSPAAYLHPHRDLTGASMNNRLRFHVPIITNDQIDFRVSHERVIMRPGELWCLDTSYLHSVRNGSDETRVHLVIECDINAKILALLPRRSPRDRAHDMFFWSLLGGKFAKALLVNSVSNPTYLKQQLAMIRNFIRWRILKIDKAG